MTPATHFLRDLGLVLTVAALATVVFQRLRLPVVAGYLVAGVLVGPQLGAGLIGEPATIRTLAELGVVLLMLFIGLEFQVRRVTRIIPRVGVAVLIEVGLMLTLGYGAATALGWPRLETLLAAGVVAISSTAVIAKTFEDREVDWRLRDLVFSLLVLEDLAAIVLVAVGTTVAGGRALDAASLGLLLGKLAALLAAMIGIGWFVIPRLIRAVVGLGRRETILVTAVGITFLFALVTEEAGYSVALGAFVAGLLMAEAGVSHQVAEIVRPVRDLFAAVFFVAVGMLLDLRAAADAWPVVVLFVVIVVAGKAGGVALGAFLTGFGTRTSVQAGMTMAQIGEFSFIVAGLGVASAAGVPLYSVAVATAIATAFTTPWLVARSEGVAWWVDRRLPAPLQTFATLYASWMDALAERPDAEGPWLEARRLRRLLMVDAAVVAVALIGTSVSLRAGRGSLVRFGVPASLESLAILALGAFVALPFGLGLVLAGRRLARHLAESAVPPVAAGKVDQGRSPRRVLQVSLEIAIVLAVGIPLVVVTLPFLPPYGATGVVLALVALLSVAFWRTAQDLDSHARAGAELVAHVLTRFGGRGGAGFEPVRTMLPGLGDLEPIEVPPGSAAVGRTLGELNLRGRTGASVVAIARGAGRIVSPDADTRFEAGDLVAVTGSREAVSQVAALMRARDTSTRSSGTDATSPPA